MDVENKVRFEDNVFIVIIDGLEYEYESDLDIIPEYNPNDFDMFFFKKYDTRENDIYTLKFDNERCGWSFPIQALVSREHDFFDNTHFLKYCYVALFKLLSSIACFKNNESDNNQIFLNDYFDYDSHLIIYDKKNTSLIPDFDFKNYIVSLSTYGYSKNGRIDNIKDIEKNLNLKRSSENIPNIEYVNSMYEIISLDMEPYARFNIMYQIIEIFISFIFESQFKFTLNNFDNDKDNLFEFKAKLDEIVNEKSRVKKLFNEYAIVAPNSVLIANCNALLEKYRNKKIDESNATCIYDVRCLIVHNMYKMERSEYSVIEIINHEFLKILQEIIYTYKTPNEYIVGAK